MDIENQFFNEVIIDAGYINMGPWEIEGVDEENEKITFKREDL